MNKSFNVSHLALTSLLVVVGALAAAAGPSDAWLTTKVKIALFSGTGLATPVNVDTVRGHVTLHGQVDTEPQKARADEVARKVDGVKGVRNLLQVVPDRRELAVKADDKAIKRDLKLELERDRSLADSKIEVKSVNQGVVLLGGEAATLSDHLHALDHARRIPGVTQVASEVKSPDQMSDHEIWRQPSPAPTTTKRDAGTVVSDLWITSDVKLRLIADSAVPAMDINVDTSDGVVTLFGMVPTAEAKQAAEADARQVDGAAKVINALQVVPKAHQEGVAERDEELQAHVQQSLAADSDLDDSSVAVEVTNGVVRLTGTVASESDRFVALLNARSVTGIRSVRNELRVESKPVKAAH